MFIDLGGFLKLFSAADYATDRLEVWKARTTARMAWSELFSKAFSETCTCVRNNLLYQSLVQLVDWHMDNGSPHLKNHLEQYYVKLIYTGTIFNTRRVAMLLIGVPGSGKSTLAQVLLNLLRDPANAFIPCFTSAHHLLAFGCCLLSL
jgi:polynucleotide 5'-kinase involved in rRNA processing